MTPTPNWQSEDGNSCNKKAAEGDEICITGISGNFPDSDNVVALRDNLFNKVDLISNDDRRWKLGHPEIPQRTGKINNVTKFDASFFGVHFKQAHTMDPMCRMLLEKTYEAVVDAGVNPRMLKGTKTGVFIGACFSESEKTWFYEKMQVNGFGITGCSRAMLANRISYWLGCTGPSYTVDSACSSSLFALEHAYRAMKDGHCTAAIVGGSNLCLHPYVSLQFSRLGVLSPDGRCRSFDKDAAGYARSEAIVVIYLQKAKDSKRVYAQILHAKTNCDGYKEQGITYPAGHIQKMLLSEFYNECKINPLDLEFVEAHGTGTRVGDPEELKALDEIFCTGRSTPLKIGTVKSNLGHSEPASGLCSITKMCIAYDTGYIPPNLHYNSPREGVVALSEGRMKVVTEKTPWNRGLSGVNSFGFGGANAHVLLKNFAKDKVNNGAPRDDLPRLICTSGRSELAVNRILDDLESRPIDVEYIRLLHSVHDFDIAGHVCRGFTLLRTNSPDMRISREVQYFTGVQRPIWFVFSGMGSQWSTMGATLMRIPVFAAAVEKCHQVLSPKGIDITRIITDPDPKIFDNVLNSFVGIAAIQIGLCDILKTIGIEPDHIIGHSVGELGCAYADGCLTAEETILCSYSRGLASIETPFIKGSMAAVGLGYQEIKLLLPLDIEVACHNGPDSSTISGPADAMKQFVKELQGKGIFAKEVPCSNIAYHSKYIAAAGPTLLKYLKKVVPAPRKRSSKWVSTSVPQHLWNETECQYSSAEYHTNNLLSPVLFEETSRLIQGNAITIEIAPHGLLQTILRRSLKKDCTNISLTKRGTHDNVEFLLTSIGKLYEVGLNPQLANLYPKVEFPVSSSTPMISHLVEWEHSEDWYVTSYRAQEKMKSGERTVRMTIADEDMDYMIGHMIDGRNLYPATGYLVLVWETLGMMRGELYTEVSVVFEDVRFLRATNIPKEGNFEFIIMVKKGSGNFEIIEGGTPIVTGKIYAKKDVSQDYRPFPDPQEENTPFVRELSAKDIYKELRLRGYNYTGLFRGIQNCTIDGNYGQLMWVNNWITFMDTMLQMKLFSIDTRGLFVPTRIEKLSIDATKHNAILSAIPDGGTKNLPVTVYEDLDIIRSGGVEIRGLVATPITKRNALGIPVLEKYQFVPNFPSYEMNVNDAIRSSVQLFLENVQTVKVKVLEYIDEATETSSEPLITTIGSALCDLPLIQAELAVISEKKLELPSHIHVDNKKLNTETNVNVMIGSKLLDRHIILSQAMSCLREKSIIISREKPSLNLEDFYSGVELLLAFKLKNETLVVMKKTAASKPAKFVMISETDENFSWVEEVKQSMKETEKLVLVTENEKLNGILGLVNCLRKEPGGEIINCLVILDPKAPKFKIDLPFYEVQLDKDIAINIYKDGQWGTYRHLQLEELTKHPAEHAYVNVTTRGDLSSLRWVEGPLRAKFSRDVVHVYYSALNFRDIMTASGRISVETVAKGRLAQECVQGLEFSGKTESGVRVMGMLQSKGLSNIVEADEFLLWPIPDNWTLEDAATMPVTYGTAFYSLIMIGKMKPGETVLIHAGSGGVGQAAINVCLYYGCKIFTTVGTQEKRAFIKNLFPQIPDKCIGNSRDTSFEEMVRIETKGKGVDLVLNSLADDKLQASVRCLANNGRFLEIGKFDIVNNTALGMYVFLREASFHGIMMDFLFTRGGEIRKEISALVYNGISNGSVKPLVRTVFETHDIEKSFRYMAAGKHIGKVLVKIRNEEHDLKAKPSIKHLEAIPKYIGYSEKSYVVTGGLGGFGLELADWLVLQGARKIVLNSRRGVVNGYQSSRIRSWISYGAQIVVNTDDITTQEGCVNLLRAANALAPVQAIFNLAVVLRDALFENQTPKSFMESFAPKSRATKYLDIESRKLCPGLANFVVFSSVSCGRGNAGQTNYGMSNAIMERICEERKREGYPALAIQWGAVGEVGLVADMQEEQHEIEIGGTLQQKISSCLQVLDQFLKQDEYAVLASMVVAEKKIGGSGCGTISDTVAAIMGVKDMKTVSQQVTLAELGMDSMMAVEIKQTLEREFELFLTAQDIRTLTFAKLQELSVQREADASTSISNRTADGLTGLKMLMKNIGDELIASEPIVNLATMLGDGEDNDLICDAEPYIFMIPGIEGMASALESMSKRLKCKVTVLQLGFDNPEEDILSIAQRLLLSIRSRLAPKANFMLLGYSFGVTIALEVAKVLESEGHKGKIFCIDGAPEFLFTLLKSNFNTTEPKILQDALLGHILDILVPKHQTDLTAKLRECDSWDSKVETFLMFVPGTIKHSKQYQRSLANVVYGRLKAIINYDMNNFTKINSPVILMRPKDCPPGVIIDENYGLNNFVENPVKVHFLEGNHVTIVDNKDCANILNRAVQEFSKMQIPKASGEIVRQIQATIKA